MELVKFTLSQLIIVIPPIIIILTLFYRLLKQQIKTLKQTQYNDAINQMESHDKIINYEMNIIRKEIKIHGYKLQGNFFIDDCDVFMKKLVNIVDDNDKLLELIELLSGELTNSEYSIESTFKDIDKKFQDYGAKHHD